jgi:predicted metal-dependent phosphoesterase TrpH
MRNIRIFITLFFLIALTSFGCKTDTVYDNDMGVDAIAGPGSWLKGDLHSHTLYSDGDSPLADVIDIAEAKGLDFFAITDHNSAEPWNDPNFYSDNLTLLYGVEWTTENGHANILSNLPFNWDEISPTLSDGGNPQPAIKAAHNMQSFEQTVLFSINHPVNPFCCTWKNSFEASKEADAIEVWNGRWLLPTSNFQSVREVYDYYLQQGAKKSMVGGSDSHTHQADNIQTLYNDLGLPTTWVYSPSKDGKDILDSIRSGRTFVSTSASGPRVVLKADLDYNPENPALVDYDIMMGDSIPESAIGKDVFFRVNVFGASIPSSILVIKNGRPVIFGKDKKPVLISDTELTDKKVKWAIAFSRDYGLSFIDKPQKGDYYRVEVRQAKTFNSDAPLGELLAGYMGALSSPIYTW